MSAPTARRFRLIDATILLIALGLGLASIRDELPGLLLKPQPDWHWMIVLNRVVTVEPCLMVQTLGWLALSVCPPRDRLRRLTCRPGFVACAAAGVIIATAMPLSAWLLWLNPRGRAPVGDDWLRFATRLELVCPMIGAGVAASWAMLVLDGRWRPQGSWVDRIGRAIGLVWVVLIPVNAATLSWCNSFF